MLAGNILKLSAEHSPNQLAIICKTGNLSYDDLDKLANRLAHGLLALGANKNTKVAIISANRAEYAITYFAAARAGCVLAHLSTRSTKKNLVDMLEKIDAEILIFESEYLSLIQKTIKHLPQLKQLISIDQAVPKNSQYNIRQFDSLIKKMPSHEPDVELSVTDPLGITFTGGTTGNPEAVLVSHLARATSATSAAVDFGITNNDVVAITTPLFHSAGLFDWFVPSVMIGATIVMQPKWDANNFMDLTQLNEITAAFFVPSQINELINHKNFSQKKLASLRNIGYAGSPMTKNLLNRARSRLPKVNFVENYGQSEICPITIRKTDHGDERIETVGCAAQHIELKIVNPKGDTATTGNAGEIIVRGKAAFEKYYGDPMGTADVFRFGEGWIWTGDIGFLDEEGFLTLIDRSKDMLISGGENIYPIEIENQLYEHKAVHECAVFGIPDDKWGEVPAAHIVLTKNTSVTANELISFCAKRIPRHKRPRVIKFVDKLPKTAVGKIKKRSLKKPYWTNCNKKI